MNEFSEVMSRQTDEALIKIVTIDRANYEEGALLAAESEIKKRELPIDLIEKEHQRLSSIKTNEQLMDEKTASSWARFLHLIIDSVLIAIISVVIMLPIALVLNDEAIAVFMSMLVILGSYFGYYITMEHKSQKTVGKMITGTKVVMEDGSRAAMGVIFIRTLCRLIPFDRVTFLFVRNGIHDSISKTRVVRD